MEKDSLTGSVKGTQELFRANTDSLIMESDLFRAGNVTEGTFTIGNAVFNVDKTTKISDLISQINSNEESNATAYWDAINGKLIIKSRTSGAGLINIEAGTSNFTDIMGLTSSEWNSDGSLKNTRLNVDFQDIGENAQFTINGTNYISTSNTVTSDLTRIKGLTINLKGLTEGSSVTLTVERDKEALADAISDVVDSYNELMENVDNAIAINGNLHDQSTLKLIRNQLRTLMTGSESGVSVFKNLDAIGIGVSAASGNNLSTTNQSIINLSFDKEKFLSAYEADKDALKSLLVGGENNSGILTKVEELLENALKGVTGYFDIANTSYERKVSTLDTKISKLNTLADRYKARLEAKFQSMDLLISNIQNQYSSFLGV